MIKKIKKKEWHLYSRNGFTLGEEVKATVNDDIKETFTIVAIDRGCSDYERPFLLSSKANFALCDLKSSGIEDYDIVYIKGAKKAGFNAWVDAYEIEKIKGDDVKGTKIKNEEYYKQHYVEYNGEQYCLGDKIMYANGGLYKDNKMVPHAEEVEIVALDTWDEYDESDYQLQAVIMINRVSENGTYLKDLVDDDGIVYKKGAEKYNEWVLFSEIEKIKGDDINE